jgi:hypothetical protein
MAITLKLCVLTGCLLRLATGRAYAFIDFEKLRQSYIRSDRGNP